MIELGQRVRRREDRETVGATVIEVADTDDGVMCLIAYDEGGEGWWPATALDTET
jgi:hypothetical protein